MNRTITIIITVIAVLVVAVILEIYRELHTFRITRYQIPTEKIHGTKRLVFLSDLHNQSYGEYNVKLLEAIRAEHPELILIGGDMLVGKSGQPFDVALAFVRELTSICPVYYANGNHEQRLKEMPEKYDIPYFFYKEQLVQAGVHFLENQSIQIIDEKSHFRIYGLEIPRECYTHFYKKEMPKGAIVKRIGTSQDDVDHVYRILLAHHPGYMHEYLDWGADLVLSGHLHGGMVRIPFLGGVLAPDFTVFPKYSGEMHLEEEQCAVVSKGLGTHTIRIRLFNPAEVVVLDIGNEKALSMTG